MRSGFCRCLLVAIVAANFGIDVFAQALRAPYYFSSQIDSILAADTTPYKFQTASWSLSFIGEYDKALEYKDGQFPNAKSAAPGEEQIATFSKYRAADARDRILKEAASSQVVILNEAHHVSMHRVYLETLLEDLSKLGYRHLGIEALDPKDSILSRKRSPGKESGFYIQDPSFGNLIRRAFELDYAVFPYEQYGHDSAQRARGRELSQAMNIKRMMDAYPEDKFIIYCGYDHAAEDSLNNFMGLPMAGQLKRLTGIDPFTIDQTVLTEYFLVGSRYRKLMQINHDAVFTDSSGHYFSQASLPRRMDCNLFHPDTKYIQGRPSWLEREGMRFIELCDEVSLSYPYLLAVYLEEDDPLTAVPVDLIEIRSEKDRKASVIYTKRKQIAIATSLTGEKQVLNME